ncbi:MAG: hypothetical protein A2854_02165 [Parcubacteria group bacterium RIFCSPHIGHO2_01_FULL_56_18]|nr:MAG: hypothetical protein A2854_02165 [Parcubacteria group bacterium RIFCSPHIGHO2_01_FULL_56_18]
MKVLKVLEEAGKIAGSISFTQQGKASKVVDKRSPDDFATQADLDAGEAMAKIFADKLPQFPIAAEENRTGGPKRKFLAALQNTLHGGTYIVVDDLDATFEFDNSVMIAGNRYGGANYGHIAGTVEDGTLTRSMMYLPRQDLMITAKKGEGCYVNGTRHRLTDTKNIEISMIYLVRHKDIPSSFDQLLNLIVYTQHPGGYVCYNSNIAAISGVVLGTLAACVIAGKLWDTPGLLAVEEAGGFIASADGQPFNTCRIPQVVIAASSEEIGQDILNLTSAYDFAENFWDNPKFQS